MSLPLVRLTGMDLIRGFVAVGRRMSITLAAQDLCLTQSAVSRQVHALEEQLGVKLLLRAHRSISFTAEGERLFRSADGAVQQLQDVLGEVRKSSVQRPVTIAASIGVTGLWLLPRLGSMQKRHPGIDVRVSANNRVSDLRNEGVDLSIRYTTPALAPDGAIRMFGESIAPVAHPSLGLKALLSAKELSRHSLLDFDDAQHPWLRWSDWLGSAGWRDAKPQGVLHFNQYDQVIHAALAGQGVALGRLELIQPLIEQGQLMQLAAPLAPSRKGTVPHAYWLLQADEQPREEVRKVAAWIVTEARRYRE